MDEEKASLLAPVRQPDLSKDCQLAGQPPVQNHAWDGGLFQCCGRGCTAQGWTSCAFAYFLPCFAFGFNLRRAFQASVWLHALLFFVLFYGIQRTFLVAVNVASDACQANLPAAVEPFRHLETPQQPAVGAYAHDTWLSGRKLLQVDDAPGKFAEAFADVLPSAEAARALIHGRSAEQGESEIGQGVHIREDTSDPATAKVLGHNFAALHAERAPRPPHAAIIPFTQMFAKATPGCKKAYVGLFILHHLAVAAALSGVVYAARQRTLMRQKFSIPGSPLRDFFAWLFCFPCALCQETRTLRINNVTDGKWEGSQLGMQSTPAMEAITVKPPKLVEV